MPLPEILLLLALVAVVLWVALYEEPRHRRRLRAVHEADARRNGRPLGNVDRGAA